MGWTLWFQCVWLGCAFWKSSAAVGCEKVAVGLWKSCKLFGSNKYKTYFVSLFFLKQLWNGSIFSPFQKPKAKSRVQGAFKTVLPKSSCFWKINFWFPPLWLAFGFLEAKAAPKSLTKGTQRMWRKLICCCRPLDWVSFPQCWSRTPGCRVRPPTKSHTCRYSTSTSTVRAPLISRTQFLVGVPELQSELRLPLLGLP